LKCLATVKRWTNSLNLFLVRTAVPGVRADPELRALVADGQSSRTSPEARYAYLYGLVLVWYLLSPVLAVLSLGPEYVADRLGGNQGTGATIGIAIADFGFGFCMAGGIDATWRFWLVQAARRRYRRVGNVLDGVSRRLMGLSQLNDGTLVIQLAAGALVAWRW
jgi:hypothetical protein